MSRRIAKRHRPFESLPRHKRSDAVISVKNRMRRDRDEYGGRFTSHLVLDEPGRPDLYNQWFDFYFPGKSRFTFWNAAIITARKAFWDKVRHIAYERVIAMMTPEEREENSKMEFEPAHFSRTGKVVAYKLVKREPMRFKQFGGLTFHEQWKKLESEIAREEPPLIYERFRVDHSYVYGIGLEIVLDADVINQAVIERAIDRFLEIGECDWVSPEPVARERLPIESENEALARVSYPAERLGLSLK